MFLPRWYSAALLTAAVLLDSHLSGVHKLSEQEYIRRGSMRMTLQLFALVTNPCEGTCGGWQAQSTDSQHGYMIDLFLLDSRLASATDGGVGGTFQPSTNRQCQLHQSSRFLVERSRLMTAISQIVKSLPHGWIEFPDFFNWFRQLSRHSGTPSFGIVFGNIPPFQGTLPLPNFGVLAFMPNATLISGN